MWRLTLVGDGGAEVHLIASLIAEAERQLPQPVALARDPGLLLG